MADRIVKIQNGNMVVCAAQFSADEIDALRAKATEGGFGFVLVDCQQTFGDQPTQPLTVTEDMGRSMDLRAAHRAAAVASMALMSSPMAFFGFGGGSRRQTVADRTPPAHRRFPVPKRR